MQLDAWWDKIWRLFGAIRVNLSSASLIIGNHTLPTTLVVKLENLKSCKVLLTDASNADDRYLLRVSGTMENLLVSLAPTAGYTGERMEEPPRLIGNGFALLQAEKAQFHYHQDL